jgi:hypothetical protein
MGALGSFEDLSLMRRLYQNFEMVNVGWWKSSVAKKGPPEGSPF